MATTRTNLHPAEADAIEATDGLVERSWPHDGLDDDLESGRRSGEARPADEWLDADHDLNSDERAWPDEQAVAPPMPDAADFGALLGTPLLAGRRGRAAGPGVAGRVVRSLGRRRGARIGAAVLAGAALFAVGDQLADRYERRANGPSARSPAQPKDTPPARELKRRVRAGRQRAARPRHGRRPRAQAAPSGRLPRGWPRPAVPAPAPQRPRPMDHGAVPSRFTSEFTP